MPAMNIINIIAKFFIIIQFIHYIDVRSTYTTNRFVQD